MADPGGHSLKYRADVDGLRAVAVLAVLFYHADLGFTGGYVGVDVFFVISGFLITGLLLKDHEGGGFQLLRFWERRIRRILPALAVVVLATLAAGWFLLLPRDLMSLGRSVVAQGLLISNVQFLREAGYFAQAAELKPLLHTWSLAVEEQFYFAFPLLFLLFRRLSRRSLAGVITGVGAFSLGLSVWWSYAHPLGNFYLMPTRGWELLAGALVAVLRDRRAPGGGRAEFVAWAGLSGILAPVFLYDRMTLFPGLAAIPPCAGAACLIWANGRSVTSAGRLLSARPLVWIGKISYSLYLWHWPLLAFARYTCLEPLSPAFRLTLLAASFGLAALSWKFVETPFRTSYLNGRRGLTFAFAGTVTAVFLGAGALLLVVRGAPSRIPAEALRHASRSLADIVSVEKFSHGAGLQEARAGDFPRLGVEDATLPVGLVLWGDSHAVAAVPVVDALCSEHRIRGVAAMHAGTAPLVGFRSNGFPGRESLAFNDAVIEYIRRHRVGHVLLVAKWGGYIEQCGDPALVRQGLLDTVAALDGVGTRIWILRQVPKPRADVPRALGVAILHGRDPNLLGISMEDHLQDVLRQDPLFAGLPERFPDARVLDPTPLFAGPTAYRFLAGDEALYCDDSHLSRVGAMTLRPLLEPVFELVPAAP